MTSNLARKDFLLSSTPVQSSEDSGYFGSNQKTNFYTLNAFSPIKELNFNLSDSFPTEQDFKNSSQQPKYDQVLEFEDFKSSEFSESEHLSENFIEGVKDNLSEKEFLDISFSKSGSTQDFAFSTRDTYNEFELIENKPGVLNQENFNDFKKPNSVPSLSHAHIKYKLQNFKIFKQSKIDFLHCLNEMNCLSIISRILSCLPPTELCAACCVNKEWKEIVQSDYNANNRLKCFIKEKNLFLNGPFKENHLGVKNVPASQLKKPFSDLTNCITDEQPLVIKYSNSRFNSFLKESEKGHLKLRKCPKCCFASKSLNGNYYKCTNCSHVFCSSCLYPIFKNHTCNKSLLPKDTIIGSKKSKKNLKRL